MDIKLQCALIAATIGFLTVRKQLLAQREKTERKLSLQFLQNAYELKLT